MMAENVYLSLPLERAEKVLQAFGNFFFKDVSRFSLLFLHSLLEIIVHVLTDL